MLDTNCIGLNKFLMNIKTNRKFMDYFGAFPGLISPRRSLGIEPHDYTSKYEKESSESDKN